MKAWIFLLMALLYAGDVFSISINDANKIGEQIWKNECNGTVEGLTNWKKGENFASVGIGHFIWYSAGKKERFQETFPEVLAFLESQGIVLPLWLKNAQGCPWNSREEFYQDFESLEMKSLRKLLLNTRHFQAIFIAKRLEKSFPQMIANVPNPQKDKVTQIFNKLSQEAAGLYALIDYLNFKGAGTSPAETYNGQGWGLLQVLLRLDPSSSHLVSDFVQAAKDILSQRIQNSPPERNEAQWKKGWFNRLDTYLMNLPLHAI